LGTKWWIPAGLFSPDALPILESVVDDADPDVRKIARWSIRLILSNQLAGGLEQS
jgi:hypothetical protein